jgi:hypothetical protein
MKSLKYEITGQFLCLRLFKNVWKVKINRLYTHVSPNNILSAEQYGSGNICVQEPIFSLINDVLQALNDRKLVGGVFCDLTKASNSVIMKFN